MLQPGRKASTGADANGPRDLPMAGACVREKLQRIGRQCVAMGCCSAAAIETAGGGEGGSRDDEWRRGRGRRVHGCVQPQRIFYMSARGVLLFLRWSFARVGQLAWDFRSLSLRLLHSTRYAFLH